MLRATPANPVAVPNHSNAEVARICSQRTDKEPECGSLGPARRGSAARARRRQLGYSAHVSASISELRVRNFGCIQNLDLSGLGRLHAFIGPNDSGKSTILRAVRTLCHGMFHSWSTVDGQMEPFQPGLEAPYELHMSGSDFELSLVQSKGGKAINTCRWRGQPFRTDEWSPELTPRQGVVQPSEQGVFRSPPLMLRLDADVLKAPSGLIEDGQVLQFGDERGAGLAGVYDAIRNRGDDAFSEISSSVRALFPTVQFVGLRNATSTTKELQIELKDGTKVPASALSEGLLYYLAFAALPYLGQPPVILIEEPENGLHPARIGDVVEVLRAVSEHSQVFMATHSPLVVNELQPEEVYVTTRDLERGTSVTRLDDTANFEERASVYQNGELWIAYADGESESALLGQDS